MSNQTQKFRRNEIKICLEKGMMKSKICKQLECSGNTVRRVENNLKNPKQYASSHKIRLNVKEFIENEVSIGPIYENYPSKMVIKIKNKFEIDLHRTTIVRFYRKLNHCISNYDFVKNN
jgi:hypothetical protein